MEDEPQPSEHGAEGATPDGDPGVTSGNEPAAGRHHAQPAEQVIFGTVAWKYSQGDAPAPRPTPRRPAHAAVPAKRRSRAKTTGRVVLVLLSVAALAATGIGWATFGQLNKSPNTTDALDEVQQAPGAPGADDGATDILLVGNDSRTDSRGNPLPLNVLKALRTEATSTLNTDTLIVLRIPHDGSRGAAISIPRDTYVPISGGAKDKINSAFAKGKQAARQRLGSTGPRLEMESDQAGRVSLVRTIQDFTGIRIDHYAEVNLLGFYLLTEAIGGVDICLNNAVDEKNSGAVFQAGRQTVSGGAALSFVRQRHGLPDGDLGRIKRQQAFLASAVNKLLSAGMLTDRGRLDRLSDAVSRSLVLDPGLDVFELADQARRMASGTVEFVTIPVTGISARDHRGQSIVTVNNRAVRTFVRNLVRHRSGTQGGSAEQPAPSGAGTPNPSSGDGNHFAPAPRLRLNALAPQGSAVGKPTPPTDPIVADGVRCVD
ncbi:MAG: LytR family transcriptional regulator [Pseudonocardiaceae bacterium]|nr:LytR family transcriptional regulator [Pseudonocardiaceae bacterium]